MTLDLINIGTKYLLSRLTYNVPIRFKSTENVLKMYWIRLFLELLLQIIIKLTSGRPFPVRTPGCQEYRTDPRCGSPGMSTSGNRTCPRGQK